MSYVEDSDSFLGETTSDSVSRDEEWIEDSCEEENRNKTRETIKDSSKSNDHTREVPAMQETDALDESVVQVHRKKKTQIILSDSESDDDEERKEPTKSHETIKDSKSSDQIPGSPPDQNKTALDESLMTTWRKNKSPVVLSDSDTSESDEEQQQPITLEDSSNYSSPEIERDFARKSVFSSTRSEHMFQHRHSTDAHTKKKLFDSVREDVIELSSGDDNALNDQSPQPLNLIEVSQTEYIQQQMVIKSLENDLFKSQNVLTSVNINGLPDKGALLRQRCNKLVTELKIQKDRFVRMAIRKDDPPDDPPNPIPKWQELERGLTEVQPRTFGKQAMGTLITQKALTVNRLEQLHGSLKNCPNEEHLADAPRGLRSELMPHQKHALAWMTWREKQKPSGGILADDMGLGKTLTMISLILQDANNKHVTDEEEESSDGENDPDQCADKYEGGTLVICPASLINQWDGEVQKHVNKGLLSVEVHHGGNRETRARRLCKYNMVVTTYSLAKNDDVKGGPLTQIRWRRIILDEAHQIRNYKSQTSIAACNFAARHRWALTGTPVHNKELDLYSLLKFLRCSPFDDLAVWKRWVANKSTGGQDRLNTVMMSLLLRRTKEQLQTKNAIACLPEKQWSTIELRLDKEESKVYQKVLIFSRTLFAQFLEQRANRNHEGPQDHQMAMARNTEYLKMRQHLIRRNGVKEIKQHEILVLLLRLRQICCHPFLITKMMEGDDRVDLEEEDGAADISLLEQLNKMNLEEDAYNPQNVAEGPGAQQETVPLAEASKGILNPSNPVFSENRRSSKIQTILHLLQSKILPTGDKVIVVSQWTSFLKLVSTYLTQERIRHQCLDGSVPVFKRMDIVDKFNDPRDPSKVLLLSLTAGGVGLNLMGGNHLILGDLHWNPQLEMQAQDRIYRVGQKKPVNVYKLLTVETIEERIKLLQEKKLTMAEELLTGAKMQHNNKLTLHDMKLLFNM